MTTCAWRIPVTFRHEKRKLEERIPAARDYIVRHGLNENIEGNTHQDVGLIVQGGLYNALMRSLQQLGLANAFGESDIPILVLNVTYPLVPSQVIDFCQGKRGVLVVEEGTPEYIEQDIATQLRRAGVNTPLHGKDILPGAGEYNVEAITTGLANFAKNYLPSQAHAQAGTWLAALQQRRADVAKALGAPLPARPPGFASAALSGLCFLL